MKVTKWSTYSGELAVSEKQDEPISGEPGSGGLSLEPSTRTDASDLTPDQAAAKTPEVKASEVQASESQASGPSSSAVPGKLMIMSPGDRAWAHEGVAPEPEVKPSSGKFMRFAAMAAAVVLATAMGAFGGALATASFRHFAAGNASAASSGALPANAFT